jgi:mRNA interferase MazF
LVLLCPVTGQVKRYLCEVLIRAGLKVRGAILVDQVKSLDWQARQGEFICALPSATTGEMLQKFGV